MSHFKNSHLNKNENESKNRRNFPFCSCSFNISFITYGSNYKGFSILNIFASSKLYHTPVEYIISTKAIYHTDFIGISFPIVAPDYFLYVSAPATSPSCRTLTCFTVNNNVHRAIFKSGVHFFYAI